jgi:hypothetical protein
MRRFLLRIIVIEPFFAGGFPLKGESEHFFLSIKVLFSVLVSSIVFLSCYSLKYFSFMLL